MAKKKRFNRPSESVFFESIFHKIANAPAKTRNKIRYLKGDLREVRYSLRHKQRVRYGVLPEWLRKLINKGKPV